MSLLVITRNTTIICTKIAESMFTLVYFHGQFNRPDTLLPFLQSNVGQDPMLQIDCIEPFKGTVEQIKKEVCEYLSNIDPQIEVIPNVELYPSTESTSEGDVVSYLAMQVFVRHRTV